MAVGGALGGGLFWVPLLVAGHYFYRRAWHRAEEAFKPHALGLVQSSPPKDVYDLSDNVSDLSRRDSYDAALARPNILASAGTHSTRGAPRARGPSSQDGMSRPNTLASSGMHSPPRREGTSRQHSNPLASSGAHSPSRDGMSRPNTLASSGVHSPSSRRGASSLRPLASARDLSLPGLFRSVCQAAAEAGCPPLVSTADPCRLRLSRAPAPPRQESRAARPSSPRGRPEQDSPVRETSDATRDAGPWGARDGPGPDSPVHRYPAARPAHSAAVARCVSGEDCLGNVWLSPIHESQAHTFCSPISRPDSLSPHRRLHRRDYQQPASESPHPTGALGRVASFGRARPDGSSSRFTQFVKQLSVGISKPNGQDPDRSVSDTSVTSTHFSPCIYQDHRWRLLSTTKRCCSCAASLLQRTSRHR